MVERIDECNHVLFLEGMSWSDEKETIVEEYRCKLCGIGFSTEVDKVWCGEKHLQDKTVELKD